MNSGLDKIVLTLHGLLSYLYNYRRLLIQVFFGVLTFSYYLPRVIHAGIFADDAGFISDFEKNKSFDGFLFSFLNYVPGRNFHIVWQWLLFHFCGTDKSGLSKIHILALIVFILNAFIASQICFLITNSSLLSIFTLISCLVYPDNYQVLLWQSAFPMHLISSFFILLAVRCSLKIYFKGAFSYINLFFLLVLIDLAIFTYDQATASSIYLLFIIVIVVKKQKGLSLLIVMNILLVIGIYVHLLRMRPNSSGPVLTSLSTDRLTSNFAYVFYRFKLSLENNFIVNYLNMSNTLLYIFIFIIFSCQMFLLFVLLLKRDFILSSSSRLRPYLTWSFHLQILGVLAFLPAGLWYLDPRHMYLPLLLFSPGFFSLLTLLKNRLWEINGVLISVLVLPIFFTWTMTFNSQLNFWNERQDSRSKLYNNIFEAAKDLDTESFLWVDISQDTLSHLLDSEHLQTASSFYSHSRVDYRIFSSSEVSQSNLCKLTNHSNNSVTNRNLYNVLIDVNLNVKLEYLPCVMLPIINFPTS